MARRSAAQRPGRARSGTAPRASALRERRGCRCRPPRPSRSRGRRTRRNAPETRRQTRHRGSSRRHGRAAPRPPRASPGYRNHWGRARRPRPAEGVVLDPNDFYILATREAVVVPPDHAAEMIPYDAFVGEFRVHFAGFFDPGFGSAEAGGSGSRAVLEVRSHEVPFLIEHGQVVGRLIYEPLIARPDRLYGRAIGSSYQSQGLALSKHFKRG